MFGKKEEANQESGSENTKSNNAESDNTKNKEELQIPVRRPFTLVKDSPSPEGNNSEVKIKKPFVVDNKSTRIEENSEKISKESEGEYYDENHYAEAVTQDDVDKLKERMNVQIEAKAKALFGNDKENSLKKIVDYADVDLESLEAPVESEIMSILRQNVDGFNEEGMNNLILRKSQQLNITEQEATKMLAEKMLKKQFEEDIEELMQQDSKGVSENIRKRLKERMDGGITYIEAVRQLAEEIFEKQFSGKNWDDLTVKRPYYTKLNKGKLDLLEDCMGKAVKDVCKDRKGRLQSRRIGLVDKALNFINTHKKSMSITALLMYCSGLGPSVLKALSGDNAKIIMDGEGGKDMDAGSAAVGQIEDFEDRWSAIMDSISQDDIALKLGDGFMVVAAADNQMDNATAEISDGNDTVNSESTGIEDNTDAEAQAMLDAMATKLTEAPEGEAQVLDITPADLIKDPELIALIDDTNDSQFSSFDLMESFSAGPLEGESGSITLHFENSSIVLQDVQVKDIDAFKTELEQKGIKFDDMKDGVSLSEFAEHKDDFDKITASHLGLSDDDVKNYEKKVVTLPISQMKCVNYNQFTPPTESELNPQVGELEDKKAEIYSSHGLDSKGELIANKITMNPSPEQIKAQEESKGQADAELSEWLTSNGHSGNFEEAIQEAKNDKDNQENEKDAAFESEDLIKSEFDNPEFEKKALDVLEKHGWSLNTIRTVAMEDGPQEVVKLVCEVVAAETYYDDKEAENLGDYSGLGAFYAQKNQDIPFNTLDSGTGVCHDYVFTVMEIIEVLKNNDIPVDGVAVLYANNTFDDPDISAHAWIMAAYKDVNTGEIKYTLFDPTYQDASADEGGSVFAIDRSHSWNAISTEDYNGLKAILGDDLPERSVAENGNNTEEMTEDQMKEAELYIRTNNQMASWQKIANELLKNHPELKGKVQIDREICEAFVKMEMRIEEAKA